MSLKKLIKKFKIYFRFFNLPLLIIDVVCRKIHILHQENLLLKTIVDREYLTNKQIIKRKKGYSIIDLKNKVVKQIFLRNNFSDKSIFIDVFYNKCYNELFKLLKIISIKPTIIVDVGANIGLFSLLVKLFYTEAKIYAIEPDHGNFIVLKENIENNQLNIIPYQYALMHTSGFVEMGVGIRGTKERELSFSASFVNSSDIRGVTLFEFCKENNIQFIDILKMDIEGEEANIFSDIIEFKKIMNIVKILVIELHDESIDRFLFHKMAFEINCYTVTYGETTYVISNF